MPIPVAIEDNIAHPPTCKDEATEGSKATTLPPPSAWPSLAEVHNSSQERIVHDSVNVPSSTVSNSDEEEWENLSNISSNTNEPSREPHDKSFNTCSTHNSDMTMNTTTSNNNDNHRLSSSSDFHRCVSTPEFSQFRGSSGGGDDDSYVLNCSISSSVDATSIAANSVCDDAVLLTQKSPTAAATAASGSATMKKVPSFKDIILLRANEEKEIKTNACKVQEHEERLKEAARRQRKNVKPRFTINKIKRCTKSTGDLRSLVIHEDAEGDGFGGGGGSGGGGGMSTLEEDDIVGETDAMEYYNRKAKGQSNRMNGSKLRPDEKKRRQYIIHKKNAQRRAQQAK